MDSYQKKLTHPQWQKKRLEVLQRDNFTCRSCGSTEKELHVHHIYYLPNKLPESYPLSAYISLCFECHQMEEDNLKLLSDTLLNRFRRMGASAKDIESFMIALHLYLNSTNEELHELGFILQTITKELKNSHG